MGQTAFPIVYFDCNVCQINNATRVDFGDVIIYNNAVVNTANTGNLNITGNLILNANSTFNISKNIPGNVSIVRSINDVILNTGSNLNIAAGVSYLQIAGNWLNNGGTLSATPPTTIRFEGIGNSIGGSSPTSFPHLRFGNTLNSVNYQINQHINCQDLIIDQDNSSRQVTINNYSVQVNGNVIFWQPNANTTNLLNINGGTLTVNGNLNFSGGDNAARIAKLLVSSGLATINGNVNWVTTGNVVCDVLEVNTGTLNLQSDITMPNNSGVINLVGAGIVNFNGSSAVSLHLNNVAGGTPAQLNTVFNSTVTFAKGITNSNTPLTFANGSYQIFTANGSISPNAAIIFGNIQINSGVSITANGDFSVQNNWTNLGGTFVHNNKRVRFVGTNTQHISKSSGEIFYNVTSNCTGPITLNDNVTILNDLTMTNGNWNINGKILFLGSGAPSFLNRTSGILYNGEFRRWWPANTAITSNSGNFYGLFPIGTANEYRPISINSTANPTGAGYIGAFHTDAYTATDGTWAANDGLGSTVQRMHDQRSTLNNYGVAGGTYALDVSFTALSSVGTLNDMRLMPYLAAGIGTHVSAIGTVAAPTVRRTGLTITQLPNTWAVGTINKDPVAGTPLRQPYYSRRTGNWNDNTVGNSTWSTDLITLSSCDCKPTPNSLVVIKSGHIVTLDIPVTTSPNGPIDYLIIENGGSLIGNNNLTIIYDMEVQGTGNFAPSGGSWMISRDLNITGNGSSSSSPTAPMTVGRHFNMSGNGTLNLNNHLYIGGSAGGSFTLTGTINASTRNINLQASGGTKNIAGTGIINGTGTFSISVIGANILAGTNLTIQPNVIINGNITVTNNGTITAMTNVNGTAAGSTWTQGANSQLNIAGNLMTTGALNASAAPNIVNYNGNNAMWVNVKTPNSNTYHTLMISNLDNRRASANLTINGNLIIQDNAAFFDNGSTISGSGGLIMSGANPTYSIQNNNNPVPSLDGSYNITSGWIKFIRGGNQNIRGINGPLPSAYYHVEFGNQGTKTLQGPILVQKDLVISGSNTVLDVNNPGGGGGGNYKITLGGNWSVTATTPMDHFNERNGEVEFNGNSLQTINWGSNDNTRQFFKLTINNTAPSAAVQILGTAATSVASNVTFIDGHLITNSYTSPNFVIKNGATVTGASDSSHVKGAVVKEGNTAFTFPVGKGIPAAGAAMYAPISISAPANATDRFVAEYFPINPHPTYNNTQHDLTINHISSCEYWMLNRLSGTSNVSVTLSWYSPSGGPRSCGITSLPDLLVARWDGTKWRDHGNGGTSGTMTSGTIVSNGVVTAFSPFTLASKLGNGTNPLPIELVYFTAAPRETYVELQWKTATQINNDYFVIEKSKDAQNWHQLVIVKGAGTTYIPMEYLEIDPQPYEGINYYRLKQVDLDGTYSYSQIVSVMFKKSVASKESILFPNPISSGSILNIQFPLWYNEVLVVLRDMQGKEVFSKLIVFEQDNLLYGIPIDHDIPAGVYLVIASSNRDILFSKKLIIK